MWFSLIPQDRPTVIILEGLTSYLSKSDGETLVHRLLDRFPLTGRLILDCMVEAGTVPTNVKPPQQGWLVNNPLYIVHNKRVQMKERYVVVERQGRTRRIKLVDAQTHQVKIPHFTIQCLQYNWEGALWKPS